MWKDSEIFKGYIENTEIDITRNKEGYVIILEKGKEIYRSFKLKKAFAVYMQMKYKEANKMKKEEIEICPYCAKEILIKWNVEKEGYQIICTECGEKIMLCDACKHAEDNKEMYCDWTMENGCFRKRKESRK